jgi:osmotically inducible protein OsmC
MKRKAEAVWRGTGKDGAGALTAPGGVLKDTPISFKTRFGDAGPGTNPEELIAAAHAGCFSMQLAFLLNAAGFTATEIHTEASVTVLPDGGGFKITASDLTLRAKIPDIEDARFQEIAADAEKNCPVSKALNLKISLDAALMS